jgi:hypothetical protein
MRKRDVREFRKDLGKFPRRAGTALTIHNPRVCAQKDAAMASRVCLPHEADPPAKTCYRQTRLGRNNNVPNK